LLTYVIAQVKSLTDILQFSLRNDFRGRKTGGAIVLDDDDEEEGIAVDVNSSLLSLLLLLLEATGVAAVLDSIEDTAIALS
jgi:hypothetical protein